jgi:hypothetical protein
VSFGVVRREAERIDRAIDIRGMAPLLQVFDMPTSIKFYCEVLGFEIISTDGKTAPTSTGLCSG